MPSVPKKPTILDAIGDNWIQRNCRRCKRYIDVVWVRHDENDPTYEWADDDLTWSHCPECVLAAMPEELSGQKPDLEATYRHIRETRSDIGLAEFELGPDELGVELGVTVRWHPPPLEMVRWYPPPSGGKARNGPFIEAYRIVGGIVHDEGFALDRAQFSPFPAFDLEPKTPTLTLVHVLLAQHVHHPRTQNSYIRFQWNPGAPAHPPELSVIGWHRIFRHDRSLDPLWSEGMRLYAEYPNRGRRKRREEVVCAHFRQRLPNAIRDARDALARNGDPSDRELTQEELVAELGWSVDKLQRHIALCEMDWDKVARMQGSRIRTRRGIYALIRILAVSCGLETHPS